MKKIFTIFTTLLLLSCSTTEHEVIIKTPSNKKVDNYHEQVKQTVMDVLNKIDPPTRGLVRTINRIETITYEQLFGEESRSWDISFSPADSPIIRRPSIACNIAIFDNNSGYAVVSPRSSENIFDDNWMGGDQGDEDEEDSSTTPMRLIAVVDSGTITSNDIISYTNDNTVNSDSTISISDVYDGENDDFLIGGSEPDTFVAGMISSYLHNKEANPGNEFVYDDVEDIVDDNTVGPLLATKWDQGIPFNYYFGNIFLSTKKRYAGCTTIAVAQIMTYLKDKSQEENFGIPLSTTWTQIEKEQYSSNSTYDNMSEVQRYTAQMIKQIADDMDVVYFGNLGTFATASMAKKYLEDYPGYNIDKDTGGRCATRLRKIVRSLNNNKPVFMSAVGKDAKGHSWVVDGYMKNEDSERNIQDYLIHCNFGWGGNNDGWYFINVLDSDNNNDALLDAGASEGDERYTWLFRYLFFE